MTRTVKMRVYMARADGSRVTVKRETDIEETRGSTTAGDVFCDFIDDNVQRDDTVLEASYTLVQTPAEFQATVEGGRR